jgi:putative effector of murein hydrolase
MAVMLSVGAGCMMAIVVEVYHADWFLADSQYLASHMYKPSLQRALAFSLRFSALNG